MLCPVCKVELAKSERLGIEIDYCPNCQGVWLDRGELNKIIDRADDWDDDDDDDYDDEPYEKAKRGATSQKTKNDHVYGDDNEKRKRGVNYKKRQSLLHEIFDMFD